jgi:hypothetical protein
MHLSQQVGCSILLTTITFGFDRRTIIVRSRKMASGLRNLASVAADASQRPKARLQVHPHDGRLQSDPLTKAPKRIFQQSAGPDFRTVTRDPAAGADAIRPTLRHTCRAAKLRICSTAVSDASRLPPSSAFAFKSESMTRLCLTRSSMLSSVVPR